VSDPTIITPRPRQRFLIIMLTVSLGLNLFLVAGVAGTAIMVSSPLTPRERFEQIAAQLQLEKDQRKAFDSFTSTMHQNEVTLRNATQHVWVELEQPNLDQARIGPLLNQTAENRADYQKVYAASLKHFMMTLTPQQRARFIELTRAAPEKRGPGHIVRKFLPHRATTPNSTNVSTTAK